MQVLFGLDIQVTRWPVRRCCIFVLLIAFSAMLWVSWICSMTSKFIYGVLNINSSCFTIKLFFIYCLQKSSNCGKCLSELCIWICAVSSTLLSCNLYFSSKCHPIYYLHERPLIAYELEKLQMLQVFSHYCCSA